MTDLEPIARAIAVITLSDTDARVVSSAMAALAADGGGRLTLLHVSSPGEVGARSLVTELMARHGERIAAGPGDRATIVQRTGNVADEVLDQAESEEADLLVVAEAGMTTQRLIRRAPCSLLVLPGVELPAPAVVVAAVDLGPGEDDVAGFAARLARRTAASLELLHIYSVPLGYAKLGIAYEDFAREMEAIARKKLDAVARRVGGGHRPLLRLIWGKHEATAILDAAEPGKYSHIVMGGRRRTPIASAVTLATVTGRVVLTEPCPVWVVRRRTTPACRVLDVALIP